MTEGRVACCLYFELELTRDVELQPFFTVYTCKVLKLIFISHIDTGLKVCKGSFIIFMYKSNI